MMDATLPHKPLLMDILKKKLLKYLLNEFTLWSCFTKFPI